MYVLILRWWILFIDIFHREVEFFQNLGGPDQFEGQYIVKTKYRRSIEV